MLVRKIIDSKYIYCPIYCQIDVRLTQYHKYFNKRVDGEIQRAGFQIQISNLALNVTFELSAKNFLMTNH